MGLAEGIYGGWGNFGAAAAALVLPSVALLAGGEDGWRWAMTLTGLVALFYSGIFYRSVRNTPKGSTYFKPRKNGGLEVTSRNDFFFYLAMNAPMYGVLGLMVWKFSGPSIGLLSEAAAQALILGITVLFGLHARQIHRVNREMLNEGVAEIYRYKFKQVAILDLAYMVTFGSELAINSVLPLFYFTTFDGVTPIQAGILASAFACMNLVARPAGGWLSDRLGTPPNIVVARGGSVRRAPDPQPGFGRMADCVSGIGHHGLRGLWPSRVGGRVCNRTPRATAHDGSDCRHGGRLWQRGRCSLPDSLFLHRFIDFLYDRCCKRSGCTAGHPVHG